MVFSLTDYKNRPGRTQRTSRTESTVIAGMIDRNGSFSQFKRNNKNMTKLKQINESDLVKINSIDNFFSIKAMAYMDLIKLPKELNELENIKNTFMYNGDRYMKIILCGEPQNLILNLPFRTNIGGCNFVIGFDAKDLPKCIEVGKLFDISVFYRNKNYSTLTSFGYEYNWNISDQFLIEKFAK